MSQSLANVLLHVVFSTRNRSRLIDAGVQAELYRYLAGILDAHKSPAHAIGGTEDHVHIACSLARTISVAQLLEEIKKSSSKWIKTKGPHYQRFAWQGGYGAFSIGQSQLESLKRYINGQQEHHRCRSFQEEFLEFLKRYQVAYDERYIWD